MDSSKRIAELTRNLAEARVELDEFRRSYEEFTTSVARMLQVCSTSLSRGEVAAAQALILATLEKMQAISGDTTRH